MFMDKKILIESNLNYHPVGSKEITIDKMVVAKDQILKFEGGYKAGILYCINNNVIKSIKESRDRRHFVTVTCKINFRKDNYRELFVTELVKIGFSQIKIDSLFNKMFSTGEHLDLDVFLEPSSLAEDFFQKVFMPFIKDRVPI